jgi:Peptidase inhibitor family I36
MFQMRAKVLGSLLAVFALMLCSIPGVALAATSSEAPSSILAPPEEPPASEEAAPETVPPPEGTEGGEVSPMSLGQCPANAVCAWSQTNYEGNFSWWPASDTGCHSHASNPNIRSGFNNTGYSVRYGGGPTMPPYTGFGLNAGANSITGLICWPA